MRLRMAPSRSERRLGTPLAAFDATFVPSNGPSKLDRPLSFWRCTANACAMGSTKQSWVPPRDMSIRALSNVWTCKSPGQADSEHLFIERCAKLPMGELSKINMTPVEDSWPRSRFFSKKVVPAESQDWHNSDSSRYRRSVRDGPSFCPLLIRVPLGHAAITGISRESTRSSMLFFLRSAPK
jgi:hypothetical protein